MARLLFCCATLLALADPAQAGPACTLRSLTGDYQIQLLELTWRASGAGQVFFSAKGRLSFDGSGGVSFDIVVREVDEFGATTSGPLTGPGTYTVAADCRAQITNPGGSTADVVIVQRGRMFLFGDPETAGEVRTGFGVEE